MEFQTGEQVEIKGYKGSFYEATILSKNRSSTSSSSQHYYKVKYYNVSKPDGSGPYEEVVHGDKIRPAAPPLLRVKGFGLHELVDAYENGGWWPGIVIDKLQSDYSVYFPPIAKEMSYPSEKLRLHQDWCNGAWISVRSANKSSFKIEEEDVVLPNKKKEHEANKSSFKIEEEDVVLPKKKKDHEVLPKKKKEPEVLPKKKKEYETLPPKKKEPEILHIDDEDDETSLPKPKPKPAINIEYQTGEEVEVMLEEEGFENSYFEAGIISKENPTQYKVKYRKLFNEDKSERLEEVVSVHQLRPAPPLIPVKYFTLYELTDVYAKGGWWVGYIWGKFREDYFVYFPSTDQELPYRLDKLRLHQDWEDGQWIYDKRNGLGSYTF